MMLNTKSSQVFYNIGSLPRSGLSLVRVLFSRRWWWATVVVLLGMALLARLGIWQLDRLEQRRARNAEIVEQLALPPLPLNGQPLPADLTDLKYRRASITGEFDFSHQVGLKNQNWMDAPGIHLITPLPIEGTSQAVLVDRGWLPLDQATPESWEAYDEAGPVTITGFIQTSQTLPGGRSTPTPLVGPQSEWYRVDIQAIQAQMPYELLPVYVLESPPQGMDTRLPYQVEPEFDLSDGPHLGYAIQWFIFALILGIIYVSYVNKKEKAGLVDASTE
jgi:surfeit locus 1 family protein